MGAAEIPEIRPTSVESLQVLTLHPGRDYVGGDVDHDDDVKTIEEARTVIKQLRDRCRFQTHQTLLWRKKAKIQVQVCGVKDRTNKLNTGN